VRVNKAAFQVLTSPLPFIPSHKGRGNGTFYEIIEIGVELITLKKLDIFFTEGGFNAGPPT
jgi:hypothetical protein